MGHVNGHSLPRALAVLVETGWWSATNDRLRLNVPPVERDTRLIALDVPGMIAETQALMDVRAQGAGAAFGLVADGERLEGLLDISQAIVIAVNHEEQALALDYSLDAAPRVLATADRAEGVRWIEVAPRVEEFLEAVARASA